MIPEAQVVALQDATGLRRETISSGQGTYEITGLPVGIYTVSFVRTGFETLRFEKVVQSLGQTRTLNATLKVSGAKEETEVGPARHTWIRLRTLGAPVLNAFRLSNFP